MAMICARVERRVVNNVVHALWRAHPQTSNGRTALRTTQHTDPCLHSFIYFFSQLGTLVTSIRYFLLLILQLPSPLLSESPFLSAPKLFFEKKWISLQLSARLSHDTTQNSHLLVTPSFGVAKLWHQLMKGVSFHELISCTLDMQKSRKTQWWFLIHSDARVQCIKKT